MERILKYPNITDTNFINKDNIFIQIDSPNWRHPVKVPLSVLSNEFSITNVYKAIDNQTLIVDPSTLKVKINSSIFKNNVIYEPLKENNNNYLPIPNDSCESRLFLRSDDNYLYVYVPSQQRWKRIKLTDWDQF